MSTFVVGFRWRDDSTDYGNIIPSPNYTPATRYQDATFSFSSFTCPAGIASSA